MHLIVAGCDVQPFESKDALIATPALDALVSPWRELRRLELGESAWDWPVHLEYAMALGLQADEGGTPWAAHATGTFGTPCAWIEPCHVKVGINDMLMLPQAALRLSDEESRAHMALMQPYFEEDGMNLRFVSATRWLATGEVFRDFVSAPLSLVEDRDLDGYSPDADNDDAGVKLRRLQGEMQMLLYTHALSDARNAQGLLPVNSFWVSGAGVMDAPVAHRSELRFDERLLEAARAGNRDAYAQAWAQVERDVLAHAQAGHLTLTLGGRQRAITWEQSKPGFLHKISALLGTLRAFHLRSLL
jgi:hypothetical protein